MLHHHLPGGNAQALGGDAGEHRRMPLARALHRETQRAPPPCRIEQDLRRLERKRAGMLEEARDAEAAQPAGGGGPRAPLGEAIEVRRLERSLQHRRKVTAVDGRAGRRAVRQLLRPKHVEPPERERVAARPPRRRLHQSLGQHVRLRPPGAPVRAGGQRVGEGEPDADVDARNAVHAAEAAREIVGRGHCAVGGVEGAEVDHRPNAEGEEAAGLVEPELRIRPAVARLVVALEALGARRHPAHRPLHQGRRREQRDISG